MALPTSPEVDVVYPHNDLLWQWNGSSFYVVGVEGSDAPVHLPASGMTVLGDDITNNNAVANTIADVTGLSFGVVTGQRYNFRFVINYTAAAITTGSRWSISGPAASELRYSSTYSLTTTSNTFNTAAAYDLPAASSASSAVTTGNIAVIEGFVLPSADGTITARFASEIANSAIIAKRGSYVQYIAV